MNARGFIWNVKENIFKKDGIIKLHARPEC